MARAHRVAWLQTGTLALVGLAPRTPPPRGVMFVVGAHVQLKVREAPKFIALNEGNARPLAPVPGKADDPAADPAAARRWPLLRH